MLEKPRRPSVKNFHVQFPSNMSHVWLLACVSIVGEPRVGDDLYIGNKTWRIAEVRHRWWRWYDKLIVKELEQGEIK